MMKKFLALVTLSVLSLSLFAQSQKIKYIKGNIAEKTAAVREASGEEAEWLCENAIDFVLTNKAVLGNDRELDGLAVAAVLSISNDYSLNLSEKNKHFLVLHLMEIFNQFSKSSTVQIAIISKISSQKDILPTSDFTSLLNNYISKTNIKTMDSSVTKAIFSALGNIGNNESFLILYTLWNNNNYKDYKENIDAALVALVPSSMNDVLSIIHNSKIEEISKLFKLVKENSNISKNSICEIAENVLSESILLVKNSSDISSEAVALQIDALNILSQNKWTRASTLALDYFEVAKKTYSEEKLSDSQMETIINSLNKISPVNAVTPLAKYLEELNHKKEQNEKVSSEVVLAVINSLGAIGDKSAFDSLLSVTYIDYPENILSAARGALAGLRW